MMQGAHVGLGRRNQVTLPKGFVSPNTTAFLCEKQQDGSILLIPEVAVPESQLYFWTKRWQEGERAASQDIERGRLYRAPSLRALTTQLDKRRRRS